MLNIRKWCWTLKAINWRRSTFMNTDYIGLATWTPSTAVRTVHPPRQLIPGSYIVTQHSRYITLTLTRCNWHTFVAKKINVGLCCVVFTRVDMKVARVGFDSDYYTAKKASSQNWTFSWTISIVWSTLQRTLNYNSFADKSWNAVKQPLFEVQ